jgi:hypothetical protein
MANRPNQSHADTLSETGLLLGEAIKPEITAHMAAVGCGAPEVENGMGLRAEFERRHQRVQAEHADEVAAARALDAGVARALGFFKPHRKLSRAAFEDDVEAMIQLGLIGGLHRDIAGMLRQGLDYYTHGLSDDRLREKLAVISIGEDALRQGLEAFQEVERLRVELQREAAEAYQARLERDEALAALMAWVRRYKALAREVLRPYPALLKQLGL